MVMISTREGRTTVFRRLGLLNLVLCISTQVFVLLNNSGRDIGDAGFCLRIRICASAFALFCVPRFFTQFVGFMSQ